MRQHFRATCPYAAYKFIIPKIVRNATFFLRKMYGNATEFGALSSIPSYVPNSLSITFHHIPKQVPHHGTCPILTPHSCLTLLFRQHQLPTDAYLIRILRILMNITASRRLYARLIPVHILFVVSLLAFSIFFSFLIHCNYAIDSFPILSIQSAQIVVRSASS